MVGEASDGAEAIKLVRQLKPDILLLDLAMPKHPGLDALRDLSSPVTPWKIEIVSTVVAGYEQGHRRCFRPDYFATIFHHGC